MKGLIIQLAYNDPLAQSPSEFLMLSRVQFYHDIQVPQSPSFAHIPIQASYPAIKLRNLSHHKHILSFLALVLRPVTDSSQRHPLFSVTSSQPSPVPSALLQAILPDLSPGPTRIGVFLAWIHERLCMSSQSITRFCRAVHMYYCPIVRNAFWGQKPHFIQFCGVHSHVE